MEILAGAPVAEKMRRKLAERIMTALDGRADRIKRNPQSFILRAAALQLLPVTGGQQDAVAIINIPARDFSRQRSQARIMLRPLDAISLEDFHVVRQEFPIAHHLEVSCAGHHHQRYRCKNPRHVTDGPGEWYADFR